MGLLPPVCSCIHCGSTENVIDDNNDYISKCPEDYSGTLLFAVKGLEARTWGKHFFQEVNSRCLLIGVYLKLFVILYLIVYTNFFKS